MFLIGLPFALNLVPPNQSVGLHTHWALTTPELWLRANSFAGWAFIGAAALGVTIVRFRPDLAESWGVLVFIGLAVAALVVTFLYLGLFT
jgi:hypothetical protein